MNPPFLAMNEKLMFINIPGMDENVKGFYWKYYQKR